MTDPTEKTVPASALLVLGCPEVPVQQALALHIAYHSGSVVPRSMPPATPQS